MYDSIENTIAPYHPPNYGKVKSVYSARPTFLVLRDEFDQGVSSERQSVQN